jgi:hypothetical protein
MKHAGISSAESTNVPGTPRGAMTRYPGALAIGSTLLLMVLSGVARSEAAGNSNGKQLGFVISHFGMALSGPAGETGACPQGMTRGPAEIFAATPDARRRKGESDDEYSHRLERGAFSIIFRNGQNMCTNPQAGGPDPNFHTVTGRDVPAAGIDLDGQLSHVGGPVAPGTCGHDDFRGTDGQRDVDNQFFRLVGCSKAYQPTGNPDGLDASMFAGEWGILITLSGVDNLENDADVEVGIYANADPIQLSPARKPLAYATYTTDSDPRFRATTHGRIVNGKLMTDPVNVRFHYVVNSMYLERPLDHARLFMTVNPDGTLDGILGGYTPTEALYDFSYGFRSAKDANGQPADQRLVAGSSAGASRVLGHTCNGAYYALQGLADGDRNPTTGRCESVSTQYELKAIQAFVVNAPSHSVVAGQGQPPR